MRPRTITFALVCALSTPVALAGQPVPKDTADLWPASQLKWEPMPGLPGAMQAPLWGHPQKGEHGVMYKWPAGTSVPLHWHSRADRAVVVAGTMLLAPEGKPAVELGPGSFFSFGGHVKHATSCKAGADCVFFLEREGTFDATMVEGAKK